MTKISVKIFFLLLLIPYVSVSQDISYDLQVADSLFQKKKFTESFEVYKAILETGEKASPKMLLKMAYIKEGLGDYSNALYYLNLYYLKTSNKKALDKMKTLADKNGLDGYEYGESDFFMNLYFKNYNTILFALFFLLSICGGFLIYQKFVKQQQPYFAGIGVVFLAAAIFFITNFGYGTSTGIIAKNSVYIMNAPSGSADVLEVVKKGHRVQVLGLEDVWAKIQWEGQTAFIKNKHIKRVTF